MTSALVQDGEDTIVRQQAEFICDTLRIAQPVKCFTHDG